MTTVPLLQVSRLRWAPGLADGQAVAPAPAEGLTFSVAPNEQVALVAGPGANAAALLRTVALITKPEAGQVLFEGTDVTRLRGGRLRALRRRLQFVGGDPMRTLRPQITVEDTLVEPLRIHRLGTAEERRESVKAAAALLGLNLMLLGRRVSSLSAALRQRLALARALTLHPRLLICEDLGQFLEPAVVRPLVESVSHACRTLGTAWLWSAPEPALAQSVADRVLTLPVSQPLAAEPAAR